MGSLHAQGRGSQGSGSLVGSGQGSHTFFFPTCLLLVIIATAPQSLEKDHLRGEKRLEGLGGGSSLFIDPGGGYTMLYFMIIYCNSTF